MKPVPLYIVRYFKGDETRLISKHLHEEPAFQMAARFIDNLKNKKNEEEEDSTMAYICAATEFNDDSDIRRLYTLSDSNFEPIGEGVTVTLEAQEDPSWDYPQHADPRTQGSGHVATDRRRQMWPFTLLPK